MRPLCVQPCAGANLRAQRKIIALVGRFVGFLYLPQGHQSKNGHFPIARLSRFWTMEKKKVHFVCAQLCLARPVGPDQALRKNTAVTTEHYWNGPLFCKRFQQLTIFCNLRVNQAENFNIGCPFSQPPAVRRTEFQTSRMRFPPARAHKPRLLPHDANQSSETGINWTLLAASNSISKEKWLGWCTIRFPGCLELPNCSVPKGLQ